MYFVDRHAELRSTIFADPPVNSVLITCRADGAILVDSKTGELHTVRMEKADLLDFAGRADSAERVDRSEPADSAERAAAERTDSTDPIAAERLILYLGQLADTHYFGVQTKKSVGEPEADDSHDHRLRVDKPQGESSQSDDSQQNSPLQYQTLREVGWRLSPAQNELAASALALFNWHRTHQICSRCGAPTVVAQGGWVRICQRDGSEHYPRTDPAIIVRVTDKADRILLARGAGWAADRWSVLAGFVEPGESFEAAVAREVFEEVGVKIGAVHYHSSQPWPFPNSIMIAFTAQAQNTELTLDAAEITEADWFTREQLQQAYASSKIRRPKNYSVSTQLINQWLTKT